MATQSPVLSPLGDPSLEIRLLEIYVRDSERRPPVTCRLRTVSLETAPPFAALSYVWGDADQRQNIVVNSQLVSVTKNLEDALRRAPILQRIHPACGPTFLLWADAICIDQEDARERSAQVQLMARLYQKAECVFAWLGSEDEDTAFKALRSIAIELNGLNLVSGPAEESLLMEMAELRWLSSYPDLCKNHVMVSRDPKVKAIPTLYNASWSAINDLLSRTYWTRVWIFQEAVLARRLILTCPTSAMVFDDLGVVAARLESLQWYLRNMPVAKPDFLGSAAWYFLKDIIDLSPVASIMRLRSDRASGLSSVQSEQRCALATVGFDLNATDPRDRVYGLLALTGMQIQPDYDKTLGQVYTDFSLAWLKASRSARYPRELMFLAYAGVGIFGEQPGLPSWVPNLRDASQMKTKISTASSAGDSFEPSAQIDSVYIQDAALVATGVEVDVVRTVYPFPQNLETSRASMGELMKEVKNVLSFFMGHKSSASTETRKAWASSTSALTAQEGKGLEKDKDLQALFSFLEEFLSAHPYGYRDETPPLQAVIRTIWCHSMSQKVTGQTVMRGLDFLKTLSRHRPRPTLEENLAVLGFSLDDSFDAAFSKKVFPIQGLEGEIAAYKGSLLQEFVNWEPIGGLTEVVELNNRLVDLSSAWRFMETERGYLGLGPKGIVPGDVVTMLKGSCIPVVLRKSGDDFIHVGTSFILGLMDGELREDISEGKYPIKVFKIL
ncbi:hypothetical protein FZEAL_8177 [Fusarium zealandicum]|uniref:Heterokaryon incompatibility domain-containing protein n=1 Tax=Fusarium zealandicum TaxID=1053134 RepID=A0A8H4UEA7_9HYPO|nr:hypothetical protein FZEAL_8177 [Fusarium zealandicum]